jgi:hypothetical protein
VVIKYKVARNLKDKKYTLHNYIRRARIAKNQEENYLFGKHEKWQIYRWIENENRWKLLEK